MMIRVYHPDMNRTVRYYQTVHLQYFCNDCDYLADVKSHSHKNLVEKMHKKKCSKSGKSVDYVPLFRTQKTHGMMGKDKHVLSHIEEHIS